MSHLMATNPSTEVTATATATVTRTVKQELVEIIEILTPEVFATFLLLTIIGAAEKYLHWWIGDYKFFDVLPVRWVFDAGHLTVITLFLYRTVRRFR